MMNCAIYLCPLRTPRGTRIGDLWRDKEGRLFLRIKRRGADDVEDIYIEDLIFEMARLTKRAPSA